MNDQQVEHAPYRIIELLNKAQPMNSEAIGFLRITEFETFSLNLKPSMFEGQAEEYEQFIKKLGVGEHNIYLTPQPAIPEGYQLVPIEPTEGMLKAGCEAGVDMNILLDDAIYATDRAVYKAMLEVAKKEGV